MIRSWFQLEQHETTVKREILAGITTFTTMVYIVIVNPKILEAAGIPFGPSMVATILTAEAGTLLLGIYARRPFAIAPYMGENAFVAFTVVQVLGYPWQTAIGAIFIGGLLFLILTLFGVRSWLAHSLPQGLKIGCGVGIGLFLTFIGMNQTGIVTLGVEGAPVHVGNLHDTSVLLAVGCFLLIGFLMSRGIKGAILTGILVTTVAAFLLGTAPLPDRWISLPPDIRPIMGALDIGAALRWELFPVLLTVFIMDFVDTMGSLVGLSIRANLQNEQGNLPEIEKPMFCDAVATIIGSLLGTTTAGVYLESATGIEAGGRTGLTAVVTALLFLLTLFFAPCFSAIPACAYGPALIIVGMLMLSPIAQIKFDDLTEVIPVFSMVVLMSFTFNLGVGMTAGFVTWPLMKLLTGRTREIAPGLWILAGLSLLFFVFYPY